MPCPVFRLLPIAAATTLAASAALAQPTAYLERSQVLPTGKVLNIYRLPTTDATGAVKYWDLTVELTVGDTGKPGGSARVVSVRSPRVVGNRFVAGFYKDAFGFMTCEVSTSILGSGRQEVAFACTAAPTGDAMALSVTTGLIAGHPFELDLRAAGIDQIPGQNDYSWGKVGFTAFSRTYYGCLSPNDIISARQVGNQINVTSYNQGSTAACGFTMTLQP